MGEHVASPFNARLVAAGAWLAPSLVAACAGALVTGVVESRGERVLLATALVALLALPVLAIGSLAVRGLIAAWGPRTLAEGWTEERGAMPRLAAWVGVVWLAMLGLAWAMFQGVWLLASWTAFKPNSISFLAPALAVLAIVVIVALSRPAADLFTWLARKIDRGWQKVGPGTLLRPSIIFVGAAITACGAGYAIWLLLIHRRLPDWSPGFLLAPTAGVIATMLAHASWRGGKRVRAIAGGLAGLATLAIIVLGVRAVRDQPADTLALWADSPLARRAIERVFDVEDLRTGAPAPAARAGAPNPDLVLITIDGARADRTPPHGGAAPMPALAELGQRGAVFKFAFAPSPTQRRSLPSILTGVSPHRIRGTATETTLRLDPRHIALAERMRAAGYRTAAFTCCLDDDARTWLRGFEDRKTDDDAVRLAYAARKYIETAQSPLFVWLHVRVPWPANREALAVDQRLAAYDRGLATVDAAIAEIVAAFTGRTPETAPILIVAGSRGEELGEHGQPFGFDDLYNTQLHVPLVIAGPRVKPRNINDTISLVDLVPSIIDLAGRVPPGGATLDGHSFATALTGVRSSTTSQAFAAILPDRGPLTQMAIIRNAWKLIDNGSTVELYDLRTDIEERVNLASQRMQVVGELRALLTARVRAAQNPPF
jgi:arylsulfatase A-like enzyme